MESIWRETPLPRFPKLAGDTKTDVLVIGGGIAGILTAYFLHQNGVAYVLVEKDRICSGNTGNTTAKITAQHGLIYSKILRSEGKEAAQKYLHANLAALEKYRQLCSSRSCDFEIKDNYVFASDGKKIERELKALNEIGYRAEYCKELPIPVNSAGAVRFSEQAQFDPIKFIAEITDGLNIYENTFVREMIGKTAVTDSGRIHADQVVCATHFPFINKHGSYFLKLYQQRAYVLALVDAPDVNGMYVDEADNGLSFRNADGMLLLGGSGARTGKDIGNWMALRHFAAEHFPDAREAYHWAAQDCMSLDRIPYIGQYSARTPGFYVETGFNKWGMTDSMLSAMLICDRILGRKNDDAEVFDPSRSIIKPQLLLNGAETVVNLLTPTRRRCPHLGCALKWNRAEHSWDCPCHGSRFSNEGKILDNPANGDLKNRS